MPIRESLPPILRGEEAADLGPDARDQLEALAHEAHVEKSLTFLRDECTARLRQPDPSPAITYLLAAASALSGEMASASQALLRLSEKLAEEEMWEPLAAVADRALDLEDTQAGARYLVQAHEGLGRDPQRIQAIERALEIIPDDLDLSLLLAVRLGEAGDLERRRTLLASLMPLFAEEDRHAGLEEAALEFSEHLHLDGLVALLNTLPILAAGGALTECEQLLGIAFPAVEDGERSDEVYEALRKVVAIASEGDAAAAAEPFRDALVQALERTYGPRLPDSGKVFKAAGLRDAARPLTAALEQFDRIAALAPGAPVHHDSFGAGRVAANDAEVVLIDFAGRRGHRMPFDAARRTLTPIPEEDLRILKITAPDALARLRAEEPGEVVVRALITLRGEADAKKLKTYLVGSDLVPPKEWTGFWRRAKVAAEKHPRIDHNRAFEQIYRLLPEGESHVEAGSDVALPAYEIRKPARTNLSAIRKFLTQHPQAEVALAKRFTRFVEKTMLNDEGDRADRARAGLYFSRWNPDHESAWFGVLKNMWESGLSITDLSAEDEQLALLDSAHRAGFEADAILSSLDSRFASVREAAAKSQAGLDDAGRAALRRTVIDRASRYPGAALRLIESELGRDPAPEDAWRLFWGALGLIEERPKASVATKVLKWLEPGGLAETALKGRECSEDVQLRIRVLLRQWRSSDRFLLPALDAVGRMGLSETVETVESDRRASSDKLFQGVGEQAEDADMPVMTRATWERLQKELERLETELRTTIPATIQRARELGDLKENAEYHAAKQKQANVGKVVASLQQRLGRARFVEDADFKDGVVGLGSEVVLESDKDVTTFWVLGEDEHHLGDHVVSFQAPVGRALMGRAIGDEVKLGEGSGRRTYRIVSIERKLPASKSEHSA